MERLTRNRPQFPRGGSDRTGSAGALSLKGGQLSYAPCGAPGSPLPGLRATATVAKDAAQWNA
jgi:hypothetical protein